MPDATRVLKGGKLIDGNGGAPIEPSVLVIKGERIEAVGPAGSVPVPPGASIVDVTGKTIMPGLIDAHVHFLGVKSMNQVTWIVDPPHLRAMRGVTDVWKVIDCGFTTVRDAGGLLAIYLKRAIEEGSIVGPRIMASGLALTQTAGHGDWHFVPAEWTSRLMLGRLCDGVAEVRKAAREQLREGADLLKIMTTGGVMSEKDKPTDCQFSLEEIRAFVEEAHNAGVRTTTHGLGTQGIKNALVAGIDCIEHGHQLDDECLDIMVKRGVYLVPTLAIVEAIVTHGPKAGVLQTSINKAIACQEVHLRSFTRALDAGIKIGLGTDYLTDPMSPMGDNAIELEMYVKKMGISPMQTIVCATKVNSEVLGLADRVGTLEPGKYADLLVVNGDPLKDITVLRDKRNIVAIYKGGSLVRRMT